MRERYEHVVWAARLAPLRSFLSLALGVSGKKSTCCNERANSEDRDSAR